MVKHQQNRSIELDVTPEIIEAAIKRDSGHCVIADAVKLALPEASKVSVDLQTIRFSLPKTGRRYIFLTPQSAQHLLLDFDQGVMPKPQKLKIGRAIQTVSIAATHRKTNPNPQHLHLPEGDPDKKHVEMVTNRISGRKEPVIHNGDPMPTGALAHPPVIKKDPKTNRRYRGQRRVFGLRILRP